MGGNAFEQRIDVELEVEFSDVDVVQVLLDRLALLVAFLLLPILPKTRVSDCHNLDRPRGPKTLLMKTS